MTRRSAPAAPAAEPAAVAAKAFAVLLAPHAGRQTGDVVEGEADRLAELIAAGDARAATPADRDQAWPRVFPL